MAHSGWLEARRRATVLLLSAVVVGTLALGHDWSGGGGSEHRSADPPAVLSGADRRVELRTASGGTVSADVPLTTTVARRGPGDRYVSRSVASTAFSMVGVTWRGRAGVLRLRVHQGGHWQPWQRLAALGDGPDRDSAERQPGRHGTDLQWVGESDGAQVAVEGRRPADLSLALIEATSTPQVAPRPRDRHRAHRRPDLLSRRAWGADESWRSGTPSYDRTVQQVHIHHTVNSNDYSAADVPGLLRGIYRYHTHNLGWSDVGYNFVVDRFGRTWVGRAGSGHRLVQGAHTLGFNSTSVGVAVLGNFDIARPGHRVVTALVQLAAWELARYHRNPRGRVGVYSHGSDRYAAGRGVHLRTVDGHRDTNETACPGRYLYDLIPTIRQRAAKRIARF